MVLECHSGKVAAIQASPFSSHLASLGEDGRIFIHDFKQNRTILRKEFLAGGCSLLWLPLAVREKFIFVCWVFFDLLNARGYAIINFVKGKQEIRKLFL